MDVRQSLIGKIENLKGQVSQINGRLQELQSETIRLTDMGKNFVGQIQGFEILLKELEDEEKAKEPPQSEEIKPSIVADTDIPAE